LTDAVKYKPNTGRLDNRAVRLNGALKVSDTYQYDKLGNVLMREQYWESQQFSETFDYDFLNRLKSSQSGSTIKINLYDAAGNIRSKTGTGTGDYLYPTQGAGAIRPHAVRSIPGIGNFEYDDNGNLKSGAGRTLEWTSFDMPKRITKGASYNEFNYGPEHQRTRQLRSNSRILYAGSQELEISGSSTTVKTYWPIGLGVEILRPDGTIEDNWFHTDRLGSPIGISDKNGAIKESLAYDPWGKRRTLDGGATPDTLDGVTDNKGYTGHEMLDQLDLVHMNGRVFDPFSARFVSADPHVTNPFVGQNYNRYSYVINNPLAYTDPTGYDSVVIKGQRDFNTGFNPSYGSSSGAYSFKEAMAPFRSYVRNSVVPRLRSAAKMAFDRKLELKGGFGAYALIGFDVEIGGDLNLYGMEANLNDVEVTLGLGYGGKVHAEGLVPAGSSAHPESGAAGSLVVPLGRPIGTEQQGGTIAIGVKAGVEGQLGPVQIAAEAKAGGQSKANGAETSGFAGAKAEGKVVMGLGASIMAKLGLFIWSLKR
jgi:RHS repeat-associated protein